MSASTSLFMHIILASVTIGAMQAFRKTLTSFSEIVAETGERADVRLVSVVGGELIGEQIITSDGFTALVDQVNRNLEHTNHNIVTASLEALAQARVTIE